MDFTQAVQTAWNMLWTNISIMEKKRRKKREYFARMKDFSPAMKCLGAEIWQMDMTAGPEAVVSYSVSKDGFFSHIWISVYSRGMPTLREQQKGIFPSGPSSASQVF